MKEYEIKLSNGRNFYRNDEGSCWLDGKYETNHDIIINELSEEIIRLLAEKKRMRVENKEYKEKYEHFYGRYCEVNSKLYGLNFENDRSKRENQQLRQTITDARKILIFKED
ncbi:hypothetical protein NQS42_18315 [Bacillus sp. C10(2022)]|uniref:hypothetical protein n=1 Tax=Bacillus sp. C10(2022) TaxID=2968454 RepID=UPI003306F1DA